MHKAALLAWISLLALLGLLLGGCASVRSERPDQRMQPCGVTPNCISSDVNGRAYVTPFPLPAAASEHWQAVLRLLSDKPRWRIEALRLEVLALLPIDATRSEAPATRENSG